MANKPVSYRYVERQEAKLQIGELSVPELRALATINQKISGMATLEELIDFLFESTVDIFPCDRIGIVFIEDDGARLVSRYVVANYAPLLLGADYTRDLDGSSLERVVNQGRPRIINDLEAYVAERPHSESSKLLLREGVRSSLTCPLVVGGRAVGVLFRSARQPNIYTETHVRLHQAIVERLSQAVEKIHRIESLARANRAYEKMLSFVTKQLRGPVTSIVVDAQSLMENDSCQADVSREALDRIVSRGELLIDLLKDYTDLARFERGELQLKVEDDLDLERLVIVPAIEMVKRGLVSRDMNIDVHLPDAAIKAEVDPQQITGALVNVLSNAIKYGREGGQIDITLSERDEFAFIVVRNEGPGFDSRRSNQLFRRFARLPGANTRDKPGTGLGLYVVWRILRAHGGHVSAESEPGEWAQFSLCIPKKFPQ
jgi:signal transduction histidine kinase